MSDPEAPPQAPDDVGATPRTMDVPDAVSRDLLESRTVLIFGEISDVLSRAVTAQVLALASRSDAPIRVLVHSPGGHIEAADTIFDVLRFVRPEVSMVGTGWVASAGALIFAAAKKERRFALPNTRFLLHQPLGGFRGRASDVEIEVAQMVSIRDRIHRIFSEATGRDVETIAEETQRNLWMTAGEARTYGLVHRIVEHIDDI